MSIGFFGWDSNWSRPLQEHFLSKSRRCTLQLLNQDSGIINSKTVNKEAYVYTCCQLIVSLIIIGI